MALDTYANLKQSIIDHLNRDDLTGYVDDFIDIAEGRHQRDIRIREMLVRADLPITDGDRYIDLPSDFLDLKQLRLQSTVTTSGRRYYPHFDQLSETELTHNSTNTPSTPRYYSVHEQIELNTEADQDYTAEILYYVPFTPLGDANTTNVLLTRAPDVYLYGALSASAPYLMEDERIGVWESLYVSGYEALNTTSRRSIRGGPQRARAPGVRG